MKKDIPILKDMENYYYEIFQLSPNPMFLSTAKNQRFLEVNRAFEKVFETTRNEIIGKSVLELDCWVKVEDYRNFTSKLTKEKNVYNYETVFKNRSGQIRVGLLTAAMIELDHTYYVVGILNDITQRKDLEKELVRLEQSNILLEMAASISHEVRNPMTTIRGFLQLLSNSDKKCCDYKENFQLMVDELDRANHLITEFLTIAQKEDREVKLTNLNDIIKTLLPLLIADALRRNKFIKTKFNKIPDLFLAEQEIRQLLVNLVKNGLDATADNGFVTIQTSMAKDKVILSIIDQGEEIAPEVLEKIGTPFFTTKQEGAGLGLAISKRIIERHNAALNINSNSLGTSFEVVFKNY